MAVDVDNLLARVAVTLGAAKAVGESADVALHPEEEKPPARWVRRRAWGQPKHRQGPGRQNDAKARPAPRCRRLPGRRRIRRVRKFTGPSGHRRRSDGELRKLLTQGAFAGWMEANVRSALESTDRAVVVCASPSCSGMSMVQRDKAAETWAKHCKTHVHERRERRERLTIPGLSGTKRHRRRLLRQVRRQHTANASRGLLGEVRAHADRQGWGRAVLDRFEMTAITANTGSNNWNTNGAWVGGVQPTAADDVTLPASAVVTIPTATTALCRSINVQASASIAFASTTAVLTIGNASGGSATFSSTCTVTLTGVGTINFVSTTTGLTITTGGKTMPSVTFNGAGGSWTNSDALTTAGIITVTAGSWTTGNFAISTSQLIVTGAGTRTITWGTSTVTITGAGSSAFGANGGSNVTWSMSSSTLVLNGAGVTFNAGTSYAFGTVNFTGSGVVTLNLTITTTFVNLTRAGTAVKTDSLLINTNTGWSISGALTLTGNSVTNRLLVNSGALGTARTVTLGASATAKTNSSNVDFQDIVLTGGAANERDFSAITGWSGDALGNTGITFTTPVTRFAVVAGNWSSTATWSATTGGAGGASVPLPQDAVVLNASSAAGTYVMDMPRGGAALTCSGFTRTLNLNLSTGVTFFGSIILGSGSTLSLTAGGLAVGGRSSLTFTSNGKTQPWSATFNNIGGTYTLQDAWSNTGTSGITQNTGTLDANGQTVSTAIFTSNSGFTRALTMGSGAWSLTSGGSLFIWNTTSTGFTLTVTGNTTSATGTAGTQTITTGGVTMPNFIQNGAGGTTQLQSAFTTAGTITLTSGTLDTNSKAVSASTLNIGNATTRTLTMGSSAITLTLAGNAFTRTALTSLSVTANTATVTLSGAASTFNGGTYNWNGLTLVLTGSGAVGINGANTFVAVTRTGTAVKTDALSLAADQTVTGTLTMTGNSVTNRVLVQSSTLGTARTITAATVVSTNADWQDITAAGAASWDLSAASGGSGDALGNTGITFTTAVPQFWRNGTGNWSDSTHWSLTSGGGATGRVPLPQDNARFDGSSGLSAATVTSDMPRLGANVDFTGATSAIWTVSLATNASIYGSLTTYTSMTRGAWTGAVIFSGRGSHTITSGGISNYGSLTVTAPGGTYTLADALVTSNTALLSLLMGTFDANNKNVTASIYVVSGTLTRAVTMGSGTWSANTPSANTVWTVGTAVGLTLSAGTSTFQVSVASTGTRTFSGGGQTYGTLSYTVAASTGALVITGANTFAAITVSSEAGNAKTLTLPSATTTAATTLTLAGVSGSLLTLNASTPASAATISSGGTVSAQYLSLTDQATSGTSSPFHAVNSTIGSNVTGWIGDGTLTGVTTTLTLASPTGAAKGGATATGVASALSLAAPTGTAKGAARVLGVATAVSFAAPVGSVKGSSTVSGAVATLTLASPAGTGTGSATAAGAAATLTFVAAPGATTGTAGVTGVSTTLTLTAFAGTAAGAAALAGATSTLALGAPPGTATGALDANVIGITVTVTLAVPGGEVKNTVAFRVGTMSVGWSAGQVESGWSAGQVDSGWSAGSAESDWTTGRVGSGWRSGKARL